MIMIIFKSILHTQLIKMSIFRMSVKSENNYFGLNAEFQICQAQL